MHRNYPTPSPSQNISIQPSAYVSKHVPEYMITARVRAMLDETERYTAAGSGVDKDRELCMNTLPLDRDDEFPKRLALALDYDGPIERAGKPCPNDALLHWPYCSSCRKELGA
ncbi:MAG: hypothetical protein ACYTE3_12885 [Planctomycetota bacterium]